MKGVGREANDVMSKKMEAQVRTEHTYTCTLFVSFSHGWHVGSTTLAYTHVHPSIHTHPHTTKQDSSGSTAIVAVVTPTLLAVANLGDSRAILLSSSSSSSPPSNYESAVQTQQLVATPLSFDHKPELPLEKARVEAAGMHAWIAVAGGSW